METWVEEWVALVWGDLPTWVEVWEDKECEVEAWVEVWEALQWVEWEVVWVT